MLNNYNVLSISDRDILSTSKNIYDLEEKNLSKIVLSSVNNFKPDIIMLGHADNLLRELYIKLKKFFQELKFHNGFLIH